MSAQPGHSKAIPDHVHPPNIKTYLIIFGALACLTVLTVVVSYIHLPRVPAIAAAVGIAMVKSSLVVLFFMHLIDERPIIYGIVAVAAFFVMFLYFLPMADCVALSSYRVAAQPVAAAAVATEQQAAR